MSAPLDLEAIDTDWFSEPAYDVIGPLVAEVKRLREQLAEMHDHCVLERENTALVNRVAALESALATNGQALDHHQARVAGLERVVTACGRYAAGKVSWTVVQDALAALEADDE